MKTGNASLMKYERAIF